MILVEIKDTLAALVLSNPGHLNQEINGVVASDLMSDVLAFSDSGALLLTGLVNPQVIRTCEIAGILAVVFVRGKEPPPETIKISEEYKIPVMSSKLTMFEACGKLYRCGLKPCPHKK